MVEFQFPDGMGTPFLRLVEPRELRLAGYDRNLTHDKQSSHIPKAFLDCMRVREEVFVHEQKWPLKLEYDADDNRSCHWVLYASVRKTGETEVRDSQTGQIKRARSSTTETIPIGTLRIIPFPHPPHPPDGAVFIDGELLPVDGNPVHNSRSDGDVYGRDLNGHTDENAPPSIGNGHGTASGTANDRTSTALMDNGPSVPDATPDAGSNGGSATSTPRPKRNTLTQVEERRRRSSLPFGIDRATDFHNGKEPYLMLGRLAVSRPYRGHGVAAQLWNAAKQWLLKNKTYFNPSVTELGLDKMKVGRAEDIPVWAGLICVHAQESVIKIYENWGFQVDKAMGKWHDQGIPHVGMFYRLDLNAPESKMGLV
ncbi:acetyltransferase [Xylariaceae sp. FL0594]|nr:acetyltransferase [Xylariaceae sp. FL0594]